MQFPIYKVDAFTEKIFGGNPAAVCPLDFWLDDEVLQSIAMENNLSETAFYCQEREGFRLRWFTPLVEVRLCGHATLATAHVLYHHLSYHADVITFYTKSGELTVSRTEEGKYLMDFPSDHPSPVNDEAVKTIIQSALDTDILEIWKGKDDYMVVLPSENHIKNQQPDFIQLASLDSRGLIITARGEDVDFVSRGFFPRTGVDEDPATGSAHTMLTPYWAPRLRANRLKAQQLSSRVGHFECIYKGDRTAIIGGAVSFLEGEIKI